MAVVVGQRLLGAPVGEDVIRLALASCRCVLIRLTWSEKRVPPPVQDIRCPSLCPDGHVAARVGSSGNAAQLVAAGHERSVLLKSRESPVNAAAAYNLIRIPTGVFNEDVGRSA